MLFFRHFVVISAGAVIALSHGAIASGAPKSNVNPETLNKSKHNEVIELSNFSSQKILEQTYFELFFDRQPREIEIAQITEEERPQPTNRRIRREINSPPDLRPSPNPLLFPTKPEEVKIETTKEVTLLEAVELALKNNKTLQRERQNLEVARASLREAESGLFPTLEGQLQYTHADSGQNQANNNLGILETAVDLINQQFIPQINEQPNINDISPLNIDNLFGAGGIDPITDSFSGGLTVQYGIYQGGRVKAQIRAAEKQVRQQQLQVEVQAQQVRFEATRNYYDLQNADAQVEISRAAVTDAARSLQDARLLEQAGLGTRFEVLQSEVDLANVQQQLTSAIAQQKVARRQLATTLGVGQQVELETAEEIQEAGDWDLSLEESIVLAYKNRAELEQQLLAREISEAQQTIELAAIRPRISFFFNYNVNDDLRDNLSINDSYNVGAQMNWTIFDGGRALAAADRAKIQAQIAETNFADQRHQIRFAVENAYYNLLANKENIGATTINVQRAEENLRLARLRFQAGVGRQSEVIEAQRDLADARGRRLQAITQYNQSLNELQRQISNLPDSQLFEVP